MPLPVPRHPALLTDLYEITMAAAYWESGKADDIATFELSVRALPPQRSYLIAAGLEQAVEYLKALSFSAEEIGYLRKHPSFETVRPEFFDFLGRLRFTGSVWAVPEGTVVFPDEPLLRVTAPIVEAQIAETYLLATISYQTSVATKAARVVQAAAGKGVVEFGARRAHGPQAGVLAARAAYIGGCIGTSNVLAGFNLGIPTYGTTAHSWTMAFEEEEEAFRRFTAVYGPSAVLLVDTYDSLEAVRKALRLRLPFRGVRIDSGDFLEASRAIRKLLDEAGRSDALILASGDLNEYSIESLLKRGAPIDVFGVGTELVTSRDAPSLSAIYKVVEIESQGSIRPTAKLSEMKSSIPGKKQVFRFTAGGMMRVDTLALADERIEGAQPLLIPVMEAGDLLQPLPPLPAVQQRASANLRLLPPSVRRFTDPDSYPVEKSPRVQELIDEVRARYGSLAPHRT